MSLTTNRNDSCLINGQKEIKYCTYCSMPIIQTNSKYKRYRCKECNRKLQNKRYKDGGKLFKDKKVSYNERRRRENMVFLLNFLAEKGCIDCGEKDPIVLEFDHVNRKNANISAVTYWGKNRLIKEIELCEIRCANCHAKKTVKQLNYYSYITFDKPHFW